MRSSVVERRGAVEHRRVTNEKWSNRRALAFIVGSSVLLWTLLIVGGTWAYRAIFHTG